MREHRARRLYLQCSNTVRWCHKPHGQVALCTRQHAAAHSLVDPATFAASGRLHLHLWSCSHSRLMELTSLCDLCRRRSQPVRCAGAGNGRMASYGNVYSWGAVTGGEFKEIDELRGKTVASLATRGHNAAVLDGNHHLHWLTTPPVRGGVCVRGSRLHTPVTAVVSHASAACHPQPTADAIQDVLDESKVSTVAMGPKHSLAVAEHGLLFSWGSQRFGQVGTGLPSEYVAVLRAPPQRA